MQSFNPQDLHQVAFNQGREAIEAAYEKARRKGLRNPVVLMLDLRDDKAREIMEIIGGGPKADDQCAEAERRGVEPRCYMHLAGDDAAKLLARIPGIPDVSDQIREPPPGCFYTVLLVAGAMSLAPTPFP
ncbi:MAG: hypothetical protein NTY19_35955 [Planctomycetota bacterium]|nr:hypothetical protein [Planctomycetota bacterium]